MLELSEKLEKIKQVFDVEKVLATTLSSQYTARYYKVNQLAYSLFHTMNNRIYMGVSRDGVYKPDDLLEAARTVEVYLKASQSAVVLELASGRGANSLYLAEKYPEATFYGVDISEGQLYFARRGARKVKNYHPEFGDYHDLSRFPDNTVDVCFVVEALCYSTNKKKVLAEVSRVLKTNGVLIVFDGYLNVPGNSLKLETQLAAKLTEVGMAVEKFEEYESFRETYVEQQWEIVREENVSPFVLPTMRRFEKLAKYFFKYPKLARLLVKVLPAEFTNNALSGYLMPTLVEDKIASYMITVLRKSF